MTHEQFVVWLHGFFEISDAKELNEKQVQIIKDHLNLFFDKKTPERSKEVEDTLKGTDLNLEVCICWISHNIFCPVHGQGGLGSPIVFPGIGSDQIIC
jgi:hypothetical protein